MTVFAINFPARTVRVFPDYSSAVNGANLGEKVVPNAAAIASQPLYDSAELHRFLDAVNGGERRFFADKSGVARAIVARLQEAAGSLPDAPAGAVIFRGRPDSDEDAGKGADGEALPCRALSPEMRAGAWQDVPAQGLFGASGAGRGDSTSPDVMAAVSPDAVDAVLNVADEPAGMDEPDPAAELAERLAANAAAIVAHVRGIAAKIAHYRELAARPGADQHEALRVQAAERELSKLLSRLADNGAADMERARFAAEGVAYLETVAPSVLARHAEPQARPAPEPKPYQGRKEGETRGRRGKMEGKRFTALRKMNLFGNGTRRRAAYQLILDNPGAAYEWLVEAGVYPADLAVFLRDGVARMED